MLPIDPVRLQAIFTACLNLGDAEQAALIAQECADDGDLKQKVLELLTAYKTCGDFLRPPAILSDSPNSTVDSGPCDELGSMIGPYKLLEKIGEGGMGIVYVAEQTNPVRRIVALKIIKLGMDTKQVVARFEAERQALALMNHPNIAKVLDAGATETGRPYFVMELVKGIPITQYCDAHKLTTRERLQLLATVCEAIQHAHQKGIIHRDLKPSNLMVELHDVRPFPKVVDFGIAKSINQRLTERTLYTNYSQMIGTPLYMSPEQAQLNGLDVDTRSDVYSLGVLLYELITGTTPFTKEAMSKISYDEIRRKIQNDDPPRPSERISTLKAEAITTLTTNQRIDSRKLQQQVRNELDWVVMKALEKDRIRRYQSATALAEDIQRYLNDEPVQACPPSLAYRLSKFTRRYRAPIATAAALLITLLAATAFSIRSAVVAEASRRDAVDARTVANSQTEEVSRQKTEVDKQRQFAVEETKNAIAERNEKNRALYIADIRLASTDLAANNIARVHETLFRHEPLDGTEDLRSWEWFYLLCGSHDESERLFDAAPSNTVSGRGGATWSPNGEFVAYRRSDGQIAIWNVNSKKVVREFRGGDLIKWSPDGKCIASRLSLVIEIQCVAEEKKPIRLSGHQNTIESMAWSPDSKNLASSSRDSTFRIWNADSGECQLIKKGSTFCVSDIAWSPSGQQVVTASKFAEGSTGLKIWNPLTGDLVSEMNEGVWFNQVAFSKDESSVIAGTIEGQVIISQLSDGHEIRKLIAHTGEINAIDISPDGEMFATGGADGLIHIWSYPDATKLKTFRGHEAQVLSIDWNPKGDRLVSTDPNSLVKFWDMDRIPTYRQITNPSQPTKGFVWSEKDSLVLFPSFHSSLTYTSKSPIPIATERIIDNDESFDLEALNWNEEYVIGFLSHFKNSSSKLRPRIRTSAGGQRFVWSEDGSRVATCWSPLGNLDPVPGPDEFVSPEVEHNRYLEIGVWDVNSLTKIAEFELHIGGYAMEFSHDGRQLAILGATKSGGFFTDGLSILDVVKDRVSLTLDQKGDSSVSWSEDGKRIACGDPSGRIVVWDIVSKESILSSKVHNTALTSLCWSNDGRRIAVGSANGEVKIIDSDTGQELLKLDDLGSSIVQIAWSPDGRQLAALGLDGIMFIWDASRGYEYFESEDYPHERSHQALSLAKDSTPKEKLKILDSILKVEPDNISALNMRASTQLTSKHYELALEDYRRVTELNSRNQVAWNQRGFAEYNLGRYSDAIESATAAIDASPRTSATPRRNRAYTYLSLEQPSKALEDYRILFDEFNSLEAGRAVADLSGQLYGPAAYEEACRELLDKLPTSQNDFDKRHVLWCLHAKLPKDMLDRGLELAEELYTNLDRFPEAGRWKANSLYRLERYREAYELLSKYTDRIPKAPSVWCWYWMAMTCQQVDKHKEALYWLDKANDEAEKVLAPEAKPDWGTRYGIQVMRAEATKVVKGE